ncbi:MAG: major capsid protein [Bacteroidales bacterium]|nr:major capsid protein [Bacteroidales bacterium]
MIKTIWTYFVDKYFKPITAAITERFNGEKQEQDLLYKTLLTEEYTPDLKWDSTTLNHAIVAADVVALDSSLPLKRRSVVEHASGTVAKLGMKFRKTESDILRINTMINNGVNEATIAGKIFDDEPKAIKGIEVRTEILFLEGLSTGVTLVTDEENTGTGVRVSYGYREKNTLHASAAKWDADGATPISDIQALVDLAESHGDSIGHLFIHKKRLDLARKSDEGKALNAVYQNLVITDKSLFPLPSRTEFISALEDEFGFKVHVINSHHLIETPDGKHQVCRPWEEPNIVGTPSDKVGRLVYGTLAEETNPVKDVDYAKSGTHILVSKFSKTDPLEEVTAVQSLCLPVIDGADSIYILHTDAVETAELSVEPSTLGFTAKAATKLASIHYDGAVSDLSVETDGSEWLTAAVRANKKLAVTVTANADTTSAEEDDTETVTAAAERTAVVTVKAGDSTFDVTVTQTA